jgi:FkbM family methyltransferase
MKEKDRTSAARSTLGLQEFGMEAALRGLRERGFVPPVVIDVGAAAGEWTQLAIHHWPSSKFFLIEPLEERRSKLEALKAKTSTPLEILFCGVADVDGVMELGVTDDLYASSFAYSGKKTRNVPVFTLDSLLAGGRIESPDFLKLDVQGFEARVLAGAQRALTNCSVVLMECQFIKFCPDMRTLDETIAMMREFDFVPYELVDILRRPLDGAMGQCDLLFVKSGHWLVADQRWG